METDERKVVPGHFSLVFGKWSNDGMAGCEDNVTDGKIWIFQSRNTEVKK